MEIILNVLNDRMQTVAYVYHCCKGKLSGTAQSTLLKAVFNGKELIKKLKDVTFIDDLEKGKITRQLEIEEKALENARVEVPLEFCSLSDLLKLFVLEKIALLNYINNKF